MSRVAADGGGSGGGGSTPPPSSAGATSGSTESVSHRLHLPWWPEGDPGKLRDAARAYRAAATALADAGEIGQRGISDVVASNSGGAIDAMAKKWSGTYYGRSCLAAPTAGAPAIDNAIATCTLLASACEQYAQHIDDARHKLEELAAELVAGLVVGGLLTFVTAGLSDAAAAANAARIAAEALDLADTVIGFVNVAFRIGGLALQGAIVGAGSDLSMQAIRVSAHQQQGLHFGELGESAGFGAVLNPALAGAGSLVGRGLNGLRGIRDVADVPGEIPWSGAGPDPALRRVGLRKATQQAIQDAQPTNAAGEWIDPETLEVIPRSSDWQYGHKPFHEWWRAQNQARLEQWTRREVIEHQNDPSHYTIQSKGTNQGHAGEIPYGAGSHTDAGDLVNSATVNGTRIAGIGDVLHTSSLPQGARPGLLDLDELTQWSSDVPAPVGR